MRSPKETAEAIEKTIREILDSKEITKERISKICKKNKVSELHIKTVAGLQHI
jgi:hypothetical protein